MFISYIITNLTIFIKLNKLNYPEAVQMILKNKFKIG